jgi:hypothetical protein
MKTCLTLAMGLALLAAARAEEFVFETATARLALDDRGCCTSLRDKADGTEWLAGKPAAFFAIKKNGATFAATTLSRAGDNYHAEFGAACVSADLSISAQPAFVRIQLVRLSDAEVESLELAHVKLQPLKRNGSWLGALWDERFAVALLGLSDCVNVTAGGNRLLAEIYREFGLEGQGVALVATPPAGLMAQVQAVEHACGLPSPQLGGAWAKQSQDVRTGYFFTDLTESNADETIRYAKLGGFGYIMTYDGAWARSLGSYPINTNNFPHGEAGLKAVVDKCHAAGLKVGMHTLTSFVSKRDPLVQPKPDPRLLKDDHATLAADMDAKAQELVATAPLTGFPTEGAFYGSQKAGFDVQVDDEIIQYRAIGGADTNTLLRCVRGFTGTKAAPHKAGAPLHHLVERYGSYLADLRTTLKGEISERLAGVINRCGFDMIYFDGGECNGANGPYWYWAGQQQRDVCERVRRPLLVQGSGGTPWTWHWFARGCCDDFAAVAPKQYLDWHKIADARESYQSSFMPAELGWWGFLAWAPHQPATTPDEVEFYAIRMLALDAPVSLETHLAALKQNGRTEELLQLLGGYERLRLGSTVPAAVRDRLRTGEWHRVDNAFLPVRYDTARVSAGNGCVVSNAFAAQPLRFRLQCVPGLAPLGAATNRVLLHAATPLPLPPPDAHAAMPGALAARIEFTKPVGDQFSVFMVGQPAPAASGSAGKPLDLLHHRALAVRLTVTGAPAAGGPPPVLNFQLEAGGKIYRDYYVDLDFAGERTIVLPEPATERMLPEFRPAYANYAFKAAMYGFNYRGILALNVRWMRAGRAPVACAVAQVEALAELDAPLKRPVLEVGAEKMTLPVELGTEDYAEFQGTGDLRVFDKQGQLLRTVRPEGRVPVLPAGAGRIVLRAADGGAAKLTLITLGAPLKF